jgi:hypothetical protein
MEEKNTQKNPKKYLKFYIYNKKKIILCENRLGPNSVRTANPGNHLTGFLFYFLKF